MGTSTSEILHFVSIPSDADDNDEGPTFIQASRLSPSGHQNQAPGDQPQGVHQILLLPSSGKVCVLCNGTVSFYSLPELSPAFPNREPTGVQWIGGVDEDPGEKADGPLVMIANVRRVLLVRVGDKLRPVKSNIEYPQCLQAARHGSIACVADSLSYALVDVEQQQKIPLFPISSNSTETTGDRNNDQINRTASPVNVASSPARATQGSPLHGRSTSLGSYLTQPRQHSPQKDTHNQQTLRPPELDTSRSPSRPRSSTETDQDGAADATVAKPTPGLRPNILTVSGPEFLLTTGTSPNEPGVGVFVNLDGDVVRGTIEFSAYPTSLIISGGVASGSSSIPQENAADDEQVYAVMSKLNADKYDHGIEIQTLPSSGSTQRPIRSWLTLGPHQAAEVPSGVSRMLTPLEHTFTEVGESLKLIRYRGKTDITSRTTSDSLADPRTRVAVERLEEEKALFESQQDDADTHTSLESEKQRTAEELKFARNLSFVRSSSLVWRDEDLWQILATPPILELEARLDQCQNLAENGEPSKRSDLKEILSLLAGLQGREPRSESDFFSFKYIKQKAALLLLIDLWQSMAHNDEPQSQQVQVTEKALLDSDLDPRIILLQLPQIQHDVLQGASGIWIHNGLVELLNTTSASFPWASTQEVATDVWMLMRRYLSAWQDRRGYASIVDEHVVFESVDAALLRILLHLDEILPRGTGLQVSTRTKLNNVVDHWKSSFTTASKMLEEYQRLFVLSRLYQSRKMAKEVLATWRRIANGETDKGGEMSPATVEARVRTYLVNISNSAIVEEYSMWLASRNPDLAIQLLTDDACRVKFAPADVVSKLKTYAPDTVQMYLEHLVFSKHLDQYSDDLVGYYIDSVVGVLETSPEAKQSLSDSYSTYRALEKPKPTYINFIHENAPPERWWQSRLRLLQLLGTGSYAQPSSSGSTELTYSIPKVLDRLAPFQEYLVSESIILDARQGRHKEAIHLLTSGLGDYDTAVRYCYFGGPIAPSSQPIDAGLLPSHEEQAELFNFLLVEFLAIQDPEDCLDRTSGLLGKFAAWFDPLQVFEKVPQSWPLHRLGEFLLRSFRALATQHSEAIILKALSASQNLQGQVAFVDACEKFGMRIEAGEQVDGGIIEAS